MTRSETSRRSVRGRSPGKRRPETGRSRLPPRPTRLIGRERELEILQRFFAGDVRLATLTGSPGIGKTRLAVEVAATIEARSPNGVAFVDLAPVSDPALVMPEILHTLGIRETPDRPPLRSLKAALQSTELLLVLDNLEQVISVGPDISELIASCPGVRVLATSREPLHVSWEREVPVPPLETGENADGAAVALFVERARAVAPEFIPSGEEITVVREICLRLDGLPLAIEMAAAWIKVLPARDILSRLARRFDLLTAAGPAVPDRHRTLRNAIAWSFDLLTPVEQRVFRGLGVLRTGFTLAAAEAISDHGGAASLLQVIASLVDKSLVHRDIAGADGMARFRLLESLREFALEALGETAEADAARTRHAAFFAGQADAAAPELRSASQRIWFDRLDRDYPDLQAALEFTLTQGDPHMALRMAWALFWFWDVRGLWREGVDWLTRALDAATSAPPPDRARGLLATGHLAFHVGDYDRARTLLEESIGLLRSLDLHRDLAEALLFLGVLHRRRSAYRAAEPVQAESLAHFTDAGDRWGELFALSELTRLARLMGDPDRARSVGGRAVSLARETGQQREIANALEDLALVELGQGKVARAEQLLREAQKIDRTIGMRQGEAATAVALGECALHRGRDDEASVLLRDGLALYRDIGDYSGIAQALVHLSTVAYRRGDAPQALAALKEAFTLLESKQEMQGIAVVLEHLATLSATTGQPDRAVMLLGAADAIRDRIGAQRWPVEHTQVEAALRRTRTALGPAAFRHAWASGSALSLGDVGVEVLALSAPEGIPEARGSGVRRGLLTRREMEVAALVAGGKTNREIAGTLFISERTADNHVLHILNKLGFVSRSQIAAWAATRGSPPQE